MRIFLTHVASRYEAREIGVSIAASNFCDNLITGGGFDEVYSILPTFVSGKRYFKNMSTKASSPKVIYSSFRWRGRFLLKLAPIMENIRLFFAIPNDASLWLYNITMLNAPLIICLRLFKRKVHIYTIVLDFTPGEKNSNLFLKMINNSDGLICLANSPLFKNKNKICLPGVVPKDARQWHRINRINKEFLISGVLNENISMLSMLLEAFVQLPECTLHITGKAMDEEMVKKFSKAYPNIIYHGMVEYEEYLYILHSTSFLLSTRNPDSPENQCNFPSKIIEALLHNRIIISTIHYPQLDGVKYLETKSNLQDFVKSIRIITEMPEESLIEYANQSETIKELFSTEVWNLTMSTIERHHR